jgi:hypothetical protein
MKQSKMKREKTKKRKENKLGIATKQGLTKQRELDIRRLAIQGGSKEEA